MSDLINDLRFEVNVLWFVLIFIIFAGFSWLQILTKRVKDITNQLEEFKGKTVLNEGSLALQKRNKR